MSNNMNAKLLLFLVLLCFPSSFMVRKPFCAAAGFKIIGTALGKIGNFAQGVTSLCELFDYINFFNCSSLSSAATTKTDDTMPDVSFGQQLVPLVVGEGNAQQNVSLILDISLDLSFMLCQRCGDYCSTNLPVYNPSQSDTFSNFTCEGSACPSPTPYITCLDGYCQYNYTDAYTTSTGFLASDTFDISQSSIVFGCGENNTGNYGDSIGYFGLGSGELSFLNQIKIGKFSYCITSNSSGYSALLFGSNATLQTTSGVSIELLPNPLLPMFYYVNFTGVTVGGDNVDIPSTAYLAQGDGTGGMLLTTTSLWTYLEESAYNATKDEFIKQMSSFSPVDASEYGLDLCFDISSGEQLTIPQLTLHFDGADMNPRNYSYFGTNLNNTVGCLLMLPFSGISILGSWMQYDMQMIYDITGSMLQFETIDCSTLI